MVGGFGSSSGNNGGTVKSESVVDAPASSATAPTTSTTTTEAYIASLKQQQQQQQQYWAKGTGFGTGSTAQTWDVDGAIERQRQQEEQATCLLHTLAAYIHPSSTGATASANNLPAEMLNIIQSSHLVSAICSYLRNDSGNFALSS